MTWRHMFAALGVLPTAACAPAAQRDQRTEAAVSVPPPEAPDSRPVPGDAATSSGGPAPTLVTILAPTVTTVPPTTVPTTTVPTTTVTVAPFVLPEAKDAGLTDEGWWKAQSGYDTPARDALLACIRSYEQGAAGYATDTGNGFYGAYQFDLATWRSVGGSGNPAHAAPAEQDDRAWQLYQERGLAPWPTPARRCV